jgi:hypothetical protein
VSRTNLATVIALVVVGAVAGFLVQIALAAAGAPKFVPYYTLALSLAFIAGVVILLALPIRRATTGVVRTRVDPFHATRVVLLAKASSIAGALLGGGAIGLLAELLVRSGEFNSDSLLKTLATLGGAIALLVAGLVGEFFCTAPPPPDDPDTDRGPGTLAR